MGSGSRMHLDRIRAAAEDAAAAEAVEVVDVELHPGAPRLLRVYLDKPGGIAHADCERVSRRLSATLDAGDLVPGAQGYVLEVSSPGLDRKLVKRDDFLRFSGSRVKITTRQPLGNRRNFTGVLEGLEQDSVRLRLEADQIVEIATDNIERANLVPTW
jgi:ribosome maturation factor RimP